ncbi:MULTISPECIES: type II toxin-antitoxin system Phd/YefM family antitoxin [Rhizobium]|jgi:prevent-host-death family protein|uniref:Prevent-host-death family protein n=1 Tax=Rhizobium metallidurans TaxID=1265931 RepID=A0A7W6GC84_9HYPH|nr:MULTISPECIES: type II toxin-antitoxin system prevent-host-death family antitoxin [Rhizobium]MBB3966488.1 prevent-host-death family protein [Rhizobium metallidurans]MBO9197305.1 type II toxin-antitoxin system prevent-host-death family antitoxin [Rhizobium sp. 16-449-1b]
MRISVKEAEGQLTELVRLANQGEEIVLTQDGRPSARITPLKKPLSAEEKSRIFNEVRERVRKMDLPPGPDAAHSQDFLYDEYGLPK